MSLSVIICFFSITTCNLLIDFPSYIKCYGLVYTFYLLSQPELYDQKLFPYAFIRILKMAANRNMLNLFDVHGSVHRNIKFIERTNKMQPCSRIYYSSVSKLLNMFRTTHRPSSGAQETVIAASGFTYVFGCRLQRWLMQQ